MSNSLYNVKMLVDVANDLKENTEKYLKKEKENIKKKLNYCFQKYLEHKQTNRTLLKSIESRPTTDFALGQQQRDLLAPLILDIMTKFNPKMWKPVTAVKRTNSNILYIIDGQHRAIVLALLGYENIPVIITKTDGATYHDYECFTTFHKKGWELYGRKMAKSFDEHWPKEIKLYLYCEDLASFHASILKEKLSDRVIIKDLFAECPQIKPFLKEYDNEKNRGVRGDNWDYRYDAIKFSYKVFAQCHMIRNSQGKKIIYLDGDTLTFTEPPMNEVEKLLPNDCMCTYLGRDETSKKTPFTETGYHMYNLGHPNIQEFADVFENIYTSGKVIDLRFQVDCYTFDVARRTIEGKYNIKNYNISPMGEKLGKKHPFVNSVLGTFMDHLKGPKRKVKGKSHLDDFKERFKEKRLKQTYWKE